MKLVESPFLFLIVILWAIFATGVNSVRCPDGKLLYLDDIPIDVVLVECAVVKDEVIREFVNSKRYERLQHLKRTLLSTSPDSSSFTVVSTSPDPNVCVTYETDLSKVANQKAIGGVTDPDNKVLYGAVYAAKNLFKSRNDDKSHPSSVRVVVIFAERFDYDTAPENLGAPEPTCKSSLAKSDWVGEAFKDAKSLLIYGSPWTRNPKMTSTQIRWEGFFWGHQNYKTLFPWTVYPTAEELNAGSYVRDNDTLTSFVNERVLANACDSFRDRKVEPPKWGCTAGADSVLELVWLFNPHSTNAEHHTFSKTVATRYMRDMLDCLKHQFSEVRAGVSMFGDKITEGSYATVQPLTTDFAKLVKSLEEVQLDEDGYELKVPFLGVARAIFDRSMGWSPTSTTAKGKKVLKVVLMSTDNKSLRPVYDGPDRGWDASAMDHRQVNTPLPNELGQILREQDVTLGVLLTQNTLSAEWTNYVNAMTGEGAHAVLKVVAPSSTVVDDVPIANLLDPVQGLLCKLR